MDEPDPIEGAAGAAALPLFGWTVKGTFTPPDWPIRGAEDPLPTEPEGGIPVGVFLPATGGDAIVGGESLEGPTTAGLGVEGARIPAGGLILMVPPPEGAGLTEGDGLGAALGAMMLGRAKDRDPLEGRRKPELESPELLGGAKLNRGRPILDPDDRPEEKDARPDEP